MNPRPFVPTPMREWAYEALDLPFGAPMEEVTRRWQTYLQKCRPDLHQNDPEMLDAAHQLTRLLTLAHQKIKEAWAAHLKQKHPSPLPYSEEAALGYDALDLPFGAPMTEVTQRWRTYLKQCHPDRHQADSEMLDLANTLTRLLTEAHETIKKAWDRHHRP